jgi:DNA invertase Pin-like site-specific DNA recombinase
VRGRSQARLWDRAVVGLAGSAALLSWAAWRQVRRRSGTLASAAPDAAEVPAALASNPAAAPAGPPGDPAPSAAAQGEPGPLAAARTKQVAIGYLFVACDTPAADAARHAQLISTECAAQGMELMTTIRDVEAACGDRRARPALRWALEQVATGAADALVVAELRQLASTVANLEPVLDWFMDHEKPLVAVDVRLDTSTAPGRLAARTLAHIGRWEGERIAEATRPGLAAARSGSAGRRRATVADVPELRERIVSLRASGMTLRGIADLLNEEGVPTVRGGERWRASSVQAVTGYRRPSASDRRADLPPAQRNAVPPPEDVSP